MRFHILEAGTSHRGSGAGEGPRGAEEEDARVHHVVARVLHCGERLLHSLAALEQRALPAHGRNRGEEREKGEDWNGQNCENGVRRLLRAKRVAHYDLARRVGLNRS